MRINRSYVIFGGFIIIAFLVGVFSEKKIKTEEVWLFNEKNVYETNIAANWENFREEHKFSKDAKIEDFSMTLDHTGNFESVKLSVVEKKGKKYSIFRYQDCSKCPNMKDNEISTWNETVKEMDNFSKLMDANDFFAKVQTINEQKFFTHDTQNTLFLVRSRRWSEEKNYPGKYYQLDQEQLIELLSPKEQKGHILQVLETTLNNFNSDENTKNIVINK